MKYLAKEAGIDAAAVDEGFDLPYYVIDGRRSGFEHCAALARRNGFDLYCDEMGRLVFRRFRKARADHTFTYGREILSLEIQMNTPFYDGVDVYGESPVSAKGSDAWCWLAKDFTPDKGSKGGGKWPLLIQDAIIRTKEAALAFADAEVHALKRSAATGILTIMGNPEVRLGDAVECRGCPHDEQNALFQVRCLRHTLDKNRGFITELGLADLAG